MMIQVRGSGFEGISVGSSGAAIGEVHLTERKPEAEASWD
jgi:hypothetical protein